MYNKSQIMRNAWNIRKTANVSMSVALKSAWAVAKAEVKADAEGKEDKKMKGSEKQLKWANDIIRNIRAAWEVAKNDEKSKAMPGYAAGVAQWEERLDRLENADYAGDIIDLFKDIRFTDDQWHNLCDIISVYRVKMPCTEGQSKILGK